MKTKVDQKSTNRWLVAWDQDAGHFFCLLISLHLIQNIFLILVTTAKLNSDFWTNRQSAAKSFLPFAYSFVSFMLRRYYWRCDFYSAYRQSAMNYKNPQIFVYWNCKFTCAWLMGAVSSPEVQLNCWCTNTIDATSLVPLNLFFPEPAY